MGVTFGRVLSNARCKQVSNRMTKETKDYKTQQLQNSNNEEKPHIYRKSSPRDSYGRPGKAESFLGSYHLGLVIGS